MAGTSQRSSEELEPDLSVEPPSKRFKLSETSGEPSVEGRSTESTETPSTSKISLETDVTSEQQKDKQSSDVAESAGASEQSTLIGETSAESSEELIQTAESSEELIQAAESSEELIQSAESSEELIQAAESSEELIQSAESSEELIQAAESSKELIQAAESNEELIQAAESSEELIQAAESNEELIQATESSEELIQTAESSEELIQATESSEELIQAAESSEELIQATESSEELIQATESSEKLIQATESSEELIQALETSEELIETNLEASERLGDTTTEAIPGTSQGTELEALKFIVMKCSNPVNRRTTLAADDESMSNFPLRSNSAYETLSSIGGGAYGTVFKAKDKSSGQVVALKKIRVSLSDDGLPVSTLREITALKSLEPYEHPHIVRLLDVCQGEEQSEGPLPDDEQSERPNRGLSLWLVFEHVERDLDSFIKSHRAQNPRSFIPPSQVRQMMKEILTGVDFLHSHRILHRDLKPQNILVTRDGKIKIADFGLARTYDFEMRLTSLVATLWYRAPEVLLGRSYASSVDIWSVGCIFAELCRLEPLFPGCSEGDQLDRIFQVVGSPTKNAWPENVSLTWSTFPYRKPKHFGAIIPDLNEHGLDLIKSMLVFNPESRITAAQALTHRYFTDSIV